MNPDNEKYSELNNPSNCDVDPPCYVYLHRLVWHPDDIEDGQLLPSAFPRGHLSGDNYVSVSRMDQVTMEAVLALADTQQKKADPDKEIFRDFAHSAILHSGEVRSLIDDKCASPFEVFPEPEDADPAHCGIRNITGKKGKGYIGQLRDMLVKAVHTHGLLNEFF